MLPPLWLATALLAGLAGLGAAGGARVRPACPLPAGCGSPEAGDGGCGAKAGCGGRARGEPCGVYTPGCGRGLRCVPRLGERAPLHALLRGKGVCLAGLASRNRTEGQPALKVFSVSAGEAWKETRRAGHSTQEPLLLQSQAPLPEISVGSVQLQQLSLSSDTKQDFEMGPCRVHLAAVLQELKAPLYLSGEDIFIPNCDTKGFYRRKQCRASKGQKRGQCWCVDKRGHRLEGPEENPLCPLPSSD
uniref:insulin-like growth factor-binding protein 6 n=1 Tax=Euleptes europaea TaxID=460621 RepID=UPI00253FE01C|nr:insulin-like growth factor-binding protein 6 [Euleptes europaea]